MKRKIFIILTLSIGLSLGAGYTWAQDSASDSAVENQGIGEMDPLEEYSQRTIKAYSLTFFGGQFSGAKYLENQRLADRAVFELGANDIMGFNGEVLPESADFIHWDAAHKEIEAGPAYGARLGVYISDNFHIDFLGVYGTGTATITMLEIESSDGDPDFAENRQQLDSDDGFKMYKGGLAFQYDANNAKVFGIRPRIGFGLGGVINRYSQLADVTALYLDANLGLDYGITENLNVSADLDLTTFAFDVEELGYSNMVSYNTFRFGLTYFIDVLPEPVRAAHNAELQNKK